MTSGPHGSRSGDASAAPQKIAILPCHCDAPEQLICGLPRRERLEKTLRKKGYEVVEDPASADRAVEDCVVLVGDEELSLCTRSVREIEDRLLSSLSKSADGPVSRHLNRKISIAVTRRLMNTRVHPNQVTVVIMIIGLLSGVVTGLGGYWAGVLGALLLQMQSVLDGTDGELSRLRFQGSKLGEWLDTLGDDLTNLAFLIGASIASTVPWITWLGLVSGALFAITEGVIYYALATIYKSGNLQSFPWDAKQSWGGPISKIEFMFKRDFFCLMFLGLALVNLLDATVVLFSIGVVSTAITLTQQVIRWRGLGPGSPAGA